MADLVEAEGLIHLVNPVSGGEHTLCGDAFDLASDIDRYEWRVARRRVVTCPNCAGIIAACRRVRIASADDAKTGDA